MDENLPTKVSKNLSAESLTFVQYSQAFLVPYNAPHPEQLPCQTRLALRFEIAYIMRIPSSIPHGLNSS
jgi:hypothetical protein